MIRTVPADAVAIVRAYPPMVICFAAALAGTAVVFDVFYLVASPGLTLAMVYTIPVLAGLIAGLVAASDEVGLERKVLGWTTAATISVAITNVVVVAMIAAMRRTGPSNWAAGFRSILLAGCSVLSVAVTIVVVGNLIPQLGIELRTKLPKKKVKVYVPPAPIAAPKPRASKEAAARAKPARVEVEPEPVEEPYAEPTYVPPAPKVVDLDEPREVVLRSEGTGHADRLVPRPRRTPSVPPSRRSHRPGRRPER
ncbi:hypothetical protein [Kribbella monticola]|uniref:hypothetical protein n=1 Tax=Kribbella monticola TaxID=2185285 RepID=UPI001E3B5B51|nr:hypothetical protein [Kribbella monticola]